MAMMVGTHQDFLLVINPGETNFPGEDHKKVCRSLAFRHEECSSGQLDDVAGFDAFQLRTGQSREEGGGSDLLESGLVHS